MVTFRPDWNPVDPFNVANQSNSEQDEPDYVFATNTDPTNFTANSASSTSLIGGDFTADFMDSDPLGDYLLARLELMHTTPNADLAVGSTFQVSLVDSSAFTEFYDNAGFLASTPLSLSSFTSGTITVTSASVPEPSSFAMLGLIAVGGAIRSRWRKRRERAAAANFA